MTALYVPPDIEEAAEAWGANCGPCAIAAVTGKTLAEVRPALGDFRGCMNPTEVRRAFAALGYREAKVESPESFGCAHVMFDGPWSVVRRAAYAHSHWIGYRQIPGLSGLLYFDANGVFRKPVGCHWMSPATWDREMIPLLLPPRATGYHVNAWIEAAPAAGGTT